MIDLGRYRAVVRVLGGVLAVLVVIDVALRLVFGIAPPALIRVGFRDPDLRDKAAGRVAAVEQRGEGGPGVAVIVGSSSARAGLRPTVLAAADPAHRRWLNLAGTGSSFDELRYTFGPLFASELDADVVVLAVHPGWLAGRIVGDPALDHVLESPNAPRTSWLLFHRGRLDHVVRTAFAGARERLLLAAGVAFPAVYPPVADPWAEFPQVHGTLDPAAAAGQLELWRRKRWYDAEWLAAADGEIADAAFVIEGCRRAARRVVVVFMPESSGLRARMPAAAEAAFRRALARVADPPPVIDLRAAIPDDEFYDHIHLNERGANRLSAELAKRLR